MKELLKSLGFELTDFAKATSGNYVYSIDNDDEFSKVWTKLDGANFLAEDPEASSITSAVINIQYEAENCLITLKGNLLTDEYSLICKELN